MPDDADREMLEEKRKELEKRLQDITEKADQIWESSSTTSF
ncbi:MAG TPA: hypothetical protein VMN77_06380 [Nitrospiria bacterium]|nr:hypothetical protein [Nitrospiria bacterium]